MSDRSGTIWIAIEGENAKKIYDIIVNSHTYKEHPDSHNLTLEYKEGLLIIMENWCCGSTFATIIPFLLGDNYYYKQYDDLDEEWETNDKEGKYFTIPDFSVDI